jgi:hypothetical protein
MVARLFDPEILQCAGVFLISLVFSGSLTAAWVIALAL